MKRKRPVQMSFLEILELSSVILEAGGMPVHCGVCHKNAECRKGDPETQCYWLKGYRRIIEHEDTLENRLFGKEDSGQLSQ